MKKSDKESMLNLVFMSQDVYNEEFYREHSDTSALIQLQKLQKINVRETDHLHGL